jgi:hypothetical protein
MSTIDDVASLQPIQASENVMLTCRDLVDVPSEVPNVSLQLSQSILHSVELVPETGLITGGGQRLQRGNERHAKVIELRDQLAKPTPGSVVDGALPRRSSGRFATRAREERCCFHNRPNHPLHLVVRRSRRDLDRRNDAASQLLVQIGRVLTRRRSRIDRSPDLVDDAIEIEWSVVLCHGRRAYTRHALVSPSRSTD